MIKDYLNVIYRRFKIFLTRQPEQVEIHEGSETYEIIAKLEDEVNDLTKEINSLKYAHQASLDRRRQFSQLEISNLQEIIDRERTKSDKQIDILSATVNNLTQALAQTNVHFKTIEKKER